ncbi:MAG TPA: hypothetical protein VF627_14035 [Abditibacterium sp.]|jgi:hypothetical protein
MRLSLALPLTIPLLIVLITTIWMGLDARSHQISVDKKPYGLNNGALAWFLTGLLLWIITFPYYLWKRAVVLGARQQARNPRAVPPIASPHEGGRDA